MLYKQHNESKLVLSRSIKNTNNRLYCASPCLNPTFDHGIQICRTPPLAQAKDFAIVLAMPTTNVI